MKHLIAALFATTIIVAINQAFGGDSIVAPRSNTVLLSAKAEASAPAEIAYLDFALCAENENAVDAEKILKRKINLLFSDFKLPVFSNIASGGSCSLTLGNLIIGFKNQSNQPYTQYHQRCHIVVTKYTREKNGIISQMVDQLLELGLVEDFCVRYGVENPDELKERAYSLAIESAKKRAKAIAAGLQRDSTRILSIKDNGNADTLSNTSKINLTGVTTEVKANVDLLIEFEINS